MTKTNSFSTIDEVKQNFTIPVKVQLSKDSK